MKKNQIQKVIVATMIAVTLTACGKEQDASVPTEVVSEDIPQEAPEETPRETPEENAEEVPVETPENMSENQGEEVLQQKQEVADDEKPSGTKTIYGNIESLSEGSFNISEAFVGSDESGDGMIMATPLNEEDKVSVTVTYNDQTEIIIETSTDGMTSSKAPGSISDLVKGSQLTIEGGWNVNVFEASKIVIFILDM